MSTYTVVATLDDSTESIEFESPSDLDATFAAIAIILDTAVGKDLWARGYVELRNPHGAVIRTMLAKEVSDG
jgi:hypothetical protein